jgi:hypothetical protein
MAYCNKVAEIARVCSLHDKCSLLKGRPPCAILAEAHSAAPNSASTKLPDSQEIRNALVEMRARQGSVVSDLEYGVLAFVYDYIVRQLRAGG